MNVIVYSADRFCDTLNITDNATEVEMKPFAPRRGNMWNAILCAKNDVMMK